MGRPAAGADLALIGLEPFIGNSIQSVTPHPLLRRKRLGGQADPLPFRLAAAKRFGEAGRGEGDWTPASGVADLAAHLAAHSVFPGSGIAQSNGRGISRVHVMGAVTVTVVPWPGALRISALPPRSAARRRRFFSPLPALTRFSSK